MQEYQSDTNWMGVLQLHYSIVHEWIKGAPSLCLVLRKLKRFIWASGNTGHRMMQIQTRTGTWMQT